MTDHQDPERPSLWQATAHPGRSFGSLSDRVRVDVAIVGGGFTGVSTALHLARQGISTALLEAGDIGVGASGRNGGQVNPGMRVSRADLIHRFGDATGSSIHALAASAPDFVFQLIGDLGIDCGAVRGGTYRLAHTSAALETFKRAADGLAAEGVAVQLLDRRAVADRVGTERYLGGYFDPRGGAVQPLDLCRGLADAAASAGAAVFIHSPARMLSRSAGNWTVRTDRGQIDADRVLVATNAYTGDLVAGLQRTILPVNSFQVATRPLEGPARQRILRRGETVADSRRLILYFRKDAHNRVVLGGRASFDSGAGDRSSDYGVLRRILIDLFPDTADVPIEFAWGGLVCITPDFLPHLHEPEPGLTVFLGYNGRGVALSIRMGAVIADALARGAPIHFPTTQLRPIPLHQWRQPALNLIMKYHAVMDQIGR